MGPEDGQTRKRYGAIGAWLTSGPPHPRGAWPTGGELALWVILILATFPPVFSALALGYFPLQMDELVIAWSAKRIAQGELIYRDFFIHYPPVGFYGLALSFELLGHSLAALRIVQIVSTMTLTGVSYLLLRRLGGARLGAAAASLVFPWAVFWYWPVPSMYWLCLPLAVAALLLIELPFKDRRGSEAKSHRFNTPAFLAGILAGLTGLSIQPLGLMTSAWLVLRVVTPPIRRSMLIAVLAGMLAPVLLVVAMLAVGGNLADAISATVVYPAQAYEQGGGFNDLPLPRMFEAALAGAWARGPVAFLLHWVILALPVLVGLFALIRFAARRRPADVVNLLMFAVIIMVYLRGRTDWVHAAFFLVFVLVLGWRLLHDDGTSGWMKRLGHGWVGLALALGVAMWTSTWLAHKAGGPSVRVDDALRARADAIMSYVPAEFQDATVLNLPHGSSLYFFRDANAPPWDWVLPPSQRTHSEDIYSGLSEWLERNEIPVVILTGDHGQKLWREPSPLSVALRRDYRPFQRAGPDPLVLLRQ
ncbi:MAG: hypothetical protein HKM89_14305 [Gemmatimonadales bacterium]|nr:hypothetical protein [Gemmatimonadales bacterium]